MVVVADDVNYLQRPLQATDEANAWPEYDHERHQRRLRYTKDRVGTLSPNEWGRTTPAPGS